MAIATLTIDITAKLANIERDLGRVSHLAEKSGKQMESAFAAAGSALAGLTAALGVGSLGASLKVVIDDLDTLAKASQKVGVSVEALSALNYAGSLADVNFEALTTGLKKLSINMAEAATGGKEQAAAFKAIGVSVTDTTGRMKSSDAVFSEIAEKFADYEDGATKTALAVQLFGKAGADLIPLLNAGAKGLADMKDEAQKLGVIVGGDLAKKSEEFNDNLTRIGASLNAVKIALVGGIIEDLVRLTNAMVAATKAAGGFFAGLSLLNNSQALNPVAALEEVDARLEKLRKTKAEMEGATGFKLAPWFYKDDVAILDTQISRAEKQQTALRELANKAGAFDFGPPVIDGPKKQAPGVKKEKTEKAAKDRDVSDQFFKDIYEAGKIPADFADAQNKKLADLQLTKEKLGLRERDAKVLELVTRLEEDAEKARRKAFENIGDPAQYAEAVEKINAALDDQKTKLTDATRSLDDYSKSAETGFNAALSSYLDDVSNLAKSTEQLITGAFRNAEDALIDFCKTGRLNFSNLADSIISDLLRIQIRESVTGPLAAAMKDAGGISGMFSSLFGGGRAAGGPVNPGQYYVVGENGPEVLVPNASGTVIPNHALGGGGSPVVVNVIESPGNGGTTQTRQEGNTRILDVFVEQVKQAVASDISRGSGAIPAALGSTYGLNRAAGAY